MDTFTRICKKCLLREMSEADTYKTMYEYIANLNPDDKTPDQEYETRLSQCKACDHLLSGMCRICGCYVEMRAAITHRHCPEMVKIDPNGENRFAALRTVCLSKN